MPRNGLLPVTLVAISFSLLKRVWTSDKLKKL